MRSLLQIKDILIRKRVCALQIAEHIAFVSQVKLERNSEGFQKSNCTLPIFEVLFGFSLNVMADEARKISANFTDSAPLREIGERSTLRMVREVKIT